MSLYERLPYGSTRRERLLAYSMPEPNSGCWLWLASLNYAGYGTLHSVENKTARAHIHSYEEFVGPVPDGFCVLHRCDTRCCINPDHLFVGTQRENIKDRDRKGRGADVKGELNGWASLTNHNVSVIAEMLRSTGISGAAIGRKFGVTKTAISSINRGRSWSHITGASPENPIRQCKNPDLDGTMVIFEARV